MSKYLSKHSTEEEWGGVEPTLDETNTPHVALTTDDNQVHYVPKVEPLSFTLHFNDDITPDKKVYANEEGYYVLTWEDIPYYGDNNRLWAIQGLKQGQYDMCLFGGMLITSDLNLNRVSSEMGWIVYNSPYGDAVDHMIAIPRASVEYDDDMVIKNDDMQIG